MPNPKDIKYWVAFSHIENLGPKKLKNLHKYFPDMKIAWQASIGELKNAGLMYKDAEKIIEARKTINPDQAWENLTNHNIQVITIKHKTYPQLLKQIHSPPVLLYIKGYWPDNENLTLAVVGTRKTTSYGRQITPAIVQDLSRTGLTIVSGLALGIDALAHQSALQVNGKTIAVLGCGLDTIYPKTNSQLAREIIDQQGCLISEYPPGTEPLKQHFPARNRIISGLSKGVLVIEGNEDSGSLITAKCAVDQNREVFAVPGNISNRSSHAPNNLIKMGAYPVTNAKDILDALDLELAQQFQENKKIIPNTREEEIIIRFLSSEPVHIDELIQKCKLKASAINSALTMMEMKGMVKHLGGMYYVISR